MQEDILSEAPLYKAWIERGREAGRREGRLLVRREKVIYFLSELFPHLIPKAQEILPTLDDPDILEQLTLNILLS